MITLPEYRVYNAESLGGAIRHFREGAGLSQAELAERIGIHRETLVRIERGQLTEQVRRIVELLKELDVRL
ncbi:MAG: helix-turn-helix transcriptional regulator, partial [Actinobacteria bacterium]|nr:helix-turn-helix transcriptional regulator [Actinomycetota bacterium]